MIASILSETIPVSVLSLSTVRGYAQRKMAILYPKGVHQMIKTNALGLNRGVIGHYVINQQKAVVSTDVHGNVGKMVILLQLGDLLLRILRLLRDLL